MRFFKIHPDVSCCGYKHGVLHDKNAIHPETQWEEGEALDRVAKGFLIEVEAPENASKVLAEVEKKDTEAMAKKESLEQDRFKDYKKRK